MRSWVLIGFLVSLISWISGATLLDRTIAKINDDIMTESDLGEIMADGAGRLNPAGTSGFEGATSETVRALFDKALLLQEARRMQINPPTDEMNRQVEQMVREIRSNFSSERDFHQALASERISLDQLKLELLERSKTDYKVYHVINSRFSISEDDIKAHESQTGGEGAVTTSYRLRRLGIEITKKDGAEAARRKAREIVGRIITDGVSFEEGVRKFSQVPGAAEDAGDMGYMSSDKLNTEIRQAVEKLDVGQASVPIVAGGYANVFYVEGKRGSRSAVREKKFFEAREELLNELRRKANLKVFDDRLTRLLPDEYRGALRALPVAGASIESTPAVNAEIMSGDGRGSAQVHSIQITPATGQATVQQQEQQPAEPRGLRRWFGGNRQ